VTVDQFIATGSHHQIESSRRDTFRLGRPSVARTFWRDLVKAIRQARRGHHPLRNSRAATRPDRLDGPARRRRDPGQRVLEQAASATWLNSSRQRIIENLAALEVAGSPTSNEKSWPKSPASARSSPELAADRREVRQRPSVPDQTRPDGDLRWRLEPDEELVVHDYPRRLRQAPTAPTVQTEARRKGGRGATRAATTWWITSLTSTTLGCCLSHGRGV